MQSLNEVDSGMQSFDTEANAVIVNEKSRIVKIFLVKYKCLIIYLILIACICEFIYIMTTKLMSNEAFTKMVLQFAMRNNSVKRLE